MNSAALARIEVEPSFAEAVSPSATDESRKWALRSSACWMGNIERRQEIADRSHRTPPPWA